MHTKRPVSRSGKWRGRTCFSHHEPAGSSKVESIRLRHAYRDSARLSADAVPGFNLLFMFDQHWCYSNRAGSAEVAGANLGGQLLKKRCAASYFTSSLCIIGSSVETLLRQCHHLHTLCFSIERVDFTLVTLSAFNNIKNLMLRGALQRRLSASLLLLAPHCRKLEFLGLIPRSVYDPNGCAGLRSILTHCICWQTLVLVEVGNEDEVLKLSDTTQEGEIPT